MNERIEFRVRTNKPRRELSLPQLTFHHADHWMKVLGMEVFSAWLMIYTWCDRVQYPQDDVSHHKDIREIAQAFGCGVDKAQKLIQTLYEFGLIDIIQEKNKYGSMKNIYYWYEIPVYADSMYCELERFRNWSDRNWHGQELAKLRKIKEEKSAITSRTEKPYGSDIPQENSGSQDEPYEKTVQQPYGKIVHNNDLNNNIVVVVVEDDQQNKNYSHEEPNGNEALCPDTIIREIQELARSDCNAELTEQYVNRLLKEFSPERIKEKIKLVGTGTGQIRNLPGLLLSALREDYVNIPGKPVHNGGGQNNNNKTSRDGPGRGYNDLEFYTPEQREENDKRKRELIKQLYMS